MILYSGEFSSSSSILCLRQFPESQSAVSREPIVSESVKLWYQYFIWNSSTYSSWWNSRNEWNKLTKLDKNVVMSTRILIPDLSQSGATLNKFKIISLYSYWVELFHLETESALQSLSYHSRAINVVTFNSKSRVYFILR